MAIRITESNARDLRLMRRKVLGRDLRRDPTDDGYLPATAVGPFRATLDAALNYGSYTTATIVAPEDAGWNGQVVTVYPDADWGTGDSRPSGATVIITWFPGDLKWYSSLRCNQLPPP